jgi:tetratricopeptide (TPR) repeat protein
MKRYALLWIWIWVACATWGQRLVVHVPSRVAAGETFRLEYTVNTTDVDGRLQLGKIPDAFDVVYGPSMSQQQSYSMVNGHTSSSSTTTYTYMLMGTKNGTFTIPPAHITVGGQTISSEAVKVTVSGGNNAPSGTTFHKEEDQRPKMRQAGSPITNNDLFIRVSANKTRVHEQEPVLLTYKVYTLVELTQLNGKMPDLTGFHTQEVELPQQKSFHVENVNGRNYKCVTWSQYVMYPQMTGRLEIPSITFKGIVVQENRNVDPFEAFFNGGSGYVEVKRDIEAPGLTIQVDSLPKRPANFSGGVGKFNVSAQLENDKVKAGDPVKIRVVVGGTGNLKLIKQPELQLPKDFDKYDPEVTDKTKLTANGVEGNMVYDFIAVPKNPGEYTIPAIDMVYYDTGINGYKTISTQPFTISVAPGDGNATVSDFTDMKDKDIRPIKKGDADLHKAGEFFYESTAYWVWIIVPLIIFLALLAIFHKRAIDNANIIKMKAKNANKVATKRLRTANRLMLKGENGLFYDEVLKALWGYVSDKLNMPEEQLSRDNVSERLAQHGVDQDTVDKLIGALDECEFERYAPGDAKGNMNKTFEAAMTAIMQIENTMKARKHGKNHTSATALWLLLLILPLTASAATKENADEEYLKGNYQQAITDYEALLKQGVSPQIYFNLGNAYFRTDNITRAILNYERAHMLSPGDEDIQFNLQFARSKTIDKIVPESEMFFFGWYKSMVLLTSVDRWAYLAVVSISLVLVLLLLYLFADSIVLRKIGFFGAVIFLVIFLLSNLFAYQQKRMLENRSGAIIISSSVNIKKSPADNSETSFVLHEGTKVDITDSSIKGWSEIHVADGREGWVTSDKIENI